MLGLSRRLVRRRQAPQRFRHFDAPLRRRFNQTQLLVNVIEPGSGMNVDPTERYAVMVIKVYTQKPDRFEIGPPRMVKYDLASRKVTDTIPWPRGEEREEEGEAAFYGPKIDFMATDAIGREHQVAGVVGPDVARCLEAARNRTVAADGRNRCGVRVRDYPITPDKLLEGLMAKGL